ncbi:MAG: hypothetical protein ACXQTI_08525 [Candidatus Nezhaarchaeales archaeon]
MKSKRKITVCVDEEGCFEIEEGVYSIERGNVREREFEDNRNGDEE